MSMEWNDILELPPSALAGDRRVPKTQLVKQAGLSKSQKALLGKVRDMRFFASLSKSNSYIQPVKNDEYDIESIIFLALELASSKGASEAMRLIHGCFPNPTVLLIMGFEEGSMAISVAIRRKSQAEHGAFVTERVQSTGLFDRKSETYKPFLSRIGYGELPQTTLLEYLRSLGDRCQLASAVRALGYYPICKDSCTQDLMAKVKEMGALTTKVNELQDRRKAKDSTLGESTKLRVEIKRLEGERNSVAEVIKELCND